MSAGRFPILSRRGFAVLLLQGAATWCGRALAQAEGRDPDRGIGGTGVASADPWETLGQDRGIGGTGVVGTIRRFGSIVVNDLRVTFPQGVPVSIDGRAATARDLRLGQVVRVLARRRGLVLVTRAIVAESEVVGPVDAVGDGTLVVLGQSVVLPEGVAMPAHRGGDHLAVSGLRRLDGAVVASLIELRSAGPARVHGVLEPGAEGELSVGGLAVAGLPPELRGHRVSLVGERRGNTFHASAVTVEPRVPFARADDLSLEAYVALSPDGLRLGSGLDVAADARVLAEASGDGPVRAVVSVRPDPSGRLKAQALRVERGGRRGTGGPTGPAPSRNGAFGAGPGGGPTGSAAGGGGSGPGGTGGNGPNGAGGGRPGR